MPFFIISLLIFFLLLKVSSRKVSQLVICTLATYSILILFQQIYLENYYNRSFEFSDPSLYIDLIKTLSLEELFDFVGSDEYKSNTFYFILNWLYYNASFQSEPFTGILLKLTNALIYLTAYLMIKSKDKDRVRLFDFLILYHPWLIFTIIRNVRDVYIIFILSLIIVVAWRARVKWYDVGCLISALISMYFIRSFIIIPMVFILLTRLWEFVSARSKILLIFSTLAIIGASVIVLRDNIVVTVSNVFLGNSVYFGGESQDEIDHISNQIAIGGLAGSSFYELLFRKAVIAFPVFLFTPHPYNWLQSYLQYREGGVYGIYTDIDNILIIAGALFNYLVVYPLLFKFLHNIRRIDLRYLVIPVFLLFFYSIFLLGNADMRIKYTFLFFVILGFHKSGMNLYDSLKDAKYLLISLLIMFAVPYI